MYHNEIISKLPKYLLNYIIDQSYEYYTAQDHAVWRYVMKQNIKHLSKVAHKSYLEGLKKSGISLDKIPNVEKMNHILKEIGWAAVIVDGFIPPASFMKFQAFKVLVIAANIRSIDHIEYTPAPDIIHEAAGHAPIIADPEYAEYLKLFGEIGCKAFSSAKDYNIYEAVRHLSILKADPYTDEQNIKNAELDLERLAQTNSEPSEMSLIRNLHWWTVEYGLIGDLEYPKIYGAGLLSSIGESYNSLKPQVKKIPYSIEAANYNFDITTQQPQLFVTPDFKYLTNVLLEFAERMALKRGGVYGLEKAIESRNTATAIFSSGLQVSGTFNEIIQKNEEVIYLKTTGQTNLNYNDNQLEGHGKEYHEHGYSSPVGKLKNQEKPLELFSDSELKAIGIIIGETANLELLSGVKVSGNVNSIMKRNGKIIIITFTECMVSYAGNVLFEPSWGVFDMAVGEKISSVFSGPADPDSFGMEDQLPKEKTHKIEYAENAKQLHNLYQQVRDFRENDYNTDNLKKIFDVLKLDYPSDWLLPLEILEQVSADGNTSFVRDIIEYLSLMKEKDPKLSRLIENGMDSVKRTAN